MNANWGHCCPLVSSLLASPNSSDAHTTLPTSELSPRMQTIGYAFSISSFNLCFASSRKNQSSRVAARLTKNRLAGHQSLGADDTHSQPFNIHLQCFTTLPEGLCRFQLIRLGALPSVSKSLRWSSDECARIGPTTAIDGGWTSACCSEERRVEKLVVQSCCNPSPIRISWLSRS
jgi:hypothetical protein